MITASPHISREDIVWTPQAGSQIAFLTCPIFECLYHGTRGGCGKTDSLLMDFAQHVGQGFGEEWRGILFRRTFKDLSDVIAKSERWFYKIWGKGQEVKYNSTDHTWKWKTGEQLLLRYFEKESDYWGYHGHAYPWIGWEELCQWSDDKCYTVMMSCCRSTVKNIPRKYRATTNPYGVGHNWIKRRFRLPHSSGKLITDSFRHGKPEPPRTSVFGHVSENKILLEADPGYINRIAAAARNPAEARAWIDGDWEIQAGGMFDDLWTPEVHIVPNIPYELIPRGWKIDRAFDWGSSRPFSVGWWAESNGEPLECQGRKIGAVPGDLIRINEWYGWNGVRNEGVRMLAEEIAQGIVDRERDMGIHARVRPGPADSSIWDLENGKSVYRDMVRKGVAFRPADKSKSSRKQGWEKVRTYFKGAIPQRAGEPRESPGLFVTQQCQQFIETVPTLPRSDKDLDDVNTEAEDHIGDETRYRCRAKLMRSKSRGF